MTPRVFGRILVCKSLLDAASHPSASPAATKYLVQWQRGYNQRLVTEMCEDVCMVTLDDM